MTDVEIPKDNLDDCLFVFYFYNKISNANCMCKLLGVKIYILKFKYCMLIGKSDGIFKKSNIKET